MCAPTVAVWTQQMVTRTVIVDGPNSRAISCQVILSSRRTVAIMACSLAGVHTLHGRSAFTNAVSLTIPVSGRRCPNNRNTLASGWRRQGVGPYSEYFRAAVPTRALHATRLEGHVAVFEVCVCARHDQQIVTEPYCARCMLNTGKITFYRRDK
jgi:hypothetical protein